jgi:hypothetical protein
MQTAQVIPFPNEDEVTPSNIGSRRFIIEDTRAYIIHAEDEDAALDLFCDMTEEEASACEVEGGGVEVYAADN